MRGGGATGSGSGLGARGEEARRGRYGAFQPFARRIELELIEARPIAREGVLARYRVVN